MTIKMARAKWLKLFKYANNEDYEQFVQEVLPQLQEKFSNVTLKSFAEFKTFLDSLIPKLIHKYLILSGTMKNCSGISPDFAEMAAQKGFPVVVSFSPGHQYNIALTTDGPYLVDLSYIQFTCKHDITDKSSRKEVLGNYKKLRDNPFSAVKIEKLPKQYFMGCRLPHGEYSTFNPDPAKAIENYKIKETEKLYPERFKF